MDIQLKKEIRTNGCDRNKDHTIIRHYNNCSELGYNMRIYKKDEEMSNVYSSD